MKYMRLFWLIPLLLLTVPLLHLTACAGPAYYSQAIAGHLSLMHSREPLEEVLGDPSTSPELAAQLRLAEQILQFAGQHLDLDNTSSFRRVVITGQDAVTWNVVVAPEFSVEPRRWCFPVAGCVPYRGYFKEERAAEFAGRMRERDLDVMISPAIAYSTLGWFEDPLLDTMLQYSDAQLAGIMFHELAHEKLYVKGDTDFSEAFASFIEEIGVRLWLAESGRQGQLTDWERRRLAAIEFNRLLQDTRLKLEQVYASEEPDEVKREEKQHLFAVLKDNYRQRVETQWDGISYYAYWMDGPLNNAHLALMNSYAGGMCAFQTLYDDAGRDLERFYDMSRQLAGEPDSQRRAWLQQPCKEPSDPDAL